MAYSSLATKSIISPNYVKRTHAIDCVSVHCPCSNMSLDTMGEIYKDPKRKSSANYGIDTNGNIAVFVDEKNASMCTSSSGADDRSVTIMVSCMVAKDPYQISDAARQSLILLIVDICIRNNIHELKWKNDKTYGLTASHGGPVDKQNMFIHTWFKDDIVDPGKWLIDDHAKLVEDTNTQLIITRENRRQIIFVGDERAEAIHNVIGDDQNVWYTRKGNAFQWVGVSNLPFENRISKNSAVCILGGATDVNYIKPKDYADKINTYARQWLSQGCAVYYTSITPVSRTGYGNISNTKIEQFNTDMQNNLMPGVGYIDAYSSIKDSFIVSDGYHYDANTCKSIYGTIIETASRTTGGIRLNAALNLDPTNFHPYIARFNRDAEPNYKALSDLRVVGAIIEAGYRYDRNGNRTEKFDNPNIKKQISGLDQYDIPYGMYTICRAKSPSEARTEMEYFQYQLYRHPPKLGAWVDITNLTNRKELNDAILTQYNLYLSDYGFRGKMGIISTRGILKTISWDKWQDEFYLYLVDHLTDLSVMNNLLDPSLFDVDGE